MKEINSYIIEKLKINKNSKSEYPYNELSNTLLPEEIAKENNIDYKNFIKVINDWINDNNITDYLNDDNVSIYSFEYDLDKKTLFNVIKNKEFTNKIYFNNENARHYLHNYTIDKYLKFSSQGIKLFVNEDILAYMYMYERERESFFIAFHKKDYGPLG